ncbi:ATP-binding cassette domain-containing protein [Lichenifustis flavocetrariae]|uniref:ATP-binding cassette domain-containing protein n=1 Tax=Lichenifustis flavocetrariae TaxID=2949735 RepID=A0AA41Z5N2_9HYPH|nr:ATP-binding cassette domain-containing protein [Lichenifustis flavocetrariae]MCW6510780.1 ATP-binding cassette domain-containing protein [Lichenifustis flavocetrariae]
MMLDAVQEEATGTSVADRLVAPNALELVGIKKSFGVVRALKGVSFACRPGEVHVLMGENGAGKSTLMRIIAGVWRPDAGVIRVRGAEVAIIGPRQSQDLGIAMVYQDTRLVPDLDVAQNIWLGREPGGAVLVDRAAMDRGAQAILDRLGIATLPLTARIRDLSVAERQIVEIARALTTDPSVLILDEPTSALDAAEIQHLFVIVRQLRAAGTAVIFISHRLPEVFAIADRITVLKDGEVVGTVDRDKVDHEQLVAMMVGREMALAYPPRATAPGAARLVVEDLSSDGRFEGVRFAARAGEVLGLGGIQGNGQSDVVRALFGLAPWTGRVMLDSTAVRLGTPARAIRAGIVYVPAERQKEGLFLPHSIRENTSLPHLRDWAGLGLIPAARERDVTRAAIERFATKTPSGEQSVASLSGGNQQKVVLGRWTVGDPKVFIFEDPTRGVDVATKLEIYRRIRTLAEAGAAVILVSSDLLELIGLSDRILVFSRGRVVNEVGGAEATEEGIVGSAVDAGTTALAGGGIKADGDAARATPATAPRRGGHAMVARYASAALLAALVLALGLATSRVSSFFLSPGNLSNIASQVAPLALVALGQFFVILLGGIDLSVGPLISLVTAIVSYTATGESLGGVVLAVVASLAAGLLTGALNAALVVRLRIPDLIATLSSYSIVFGLALIVRPSPGGLVGDRFLDIFSANVGPVPAAAIVVVVLFLLAELLLVRGRLGQRLYGVGSNAEAAHVVGIGTRAVRALAYVVCAICAAGAGLLIAARIGSGDPQAGASFTLASVTAVVVGGVSVFGGRGTAIGVLLGAIAVGVMQNALNLMHVSAYFQYVWTGGLTLIAVAGYSLRLSRRRAL